MSFRRSRPALLRHGGRKHFPGRRFHRHGFAAGLQRYRCIDCGHTFNALTHMPLVGLRRRECRPRCEVPLRSSCETNGISATSGNSAYKYHPRGYMPVDAVDRTSSTHCKYKPVIRSVRRRPVQTDSLRCRGLLAPAPPVYCRPVLHPDPLPSGLYKRRCSRWLGISSEYGIMLPIDVGCGHRCPYPGAMATCSQCAGTVSVEASSTRCQPVKLAR